MTLTYQTHEFSTDNRQNHMEALEDRVYDRLTAIYDKYSTDSRTDLRLSDIEPKDYGWAPQNFEEIDTLIKGGNNFIAADLAERRIDAVTTAQMFTL